MKGYLNFIMSNKMRLFFLTLFFSGKFKYAPGTVGSVVATFLAIPIAMLSSDTLFLLAVLIGGVAAKQINIYEQSGGEHDDKSIVIDELVGVWIAISMISFSWIGLLLAFVFFRIFDIAKPSFIGLIDKKVKGGLGVVGDDALAGILAGLCANGVLKLHSVIVG